MDLFIWIWNLAPYWFQQILQILGIMIALYIMGMFLLDLARIVDASEEQQHQSNITNNLLRQVLDIIDPDEEEDDEDDDDTADEEAIDLDELERRVSEAFAGDPILGPLSIDIEVKALEGGAIELIGFVNHKAIWDRVVEVTRGVEGVNEVISLLSISRHHQKEDESEDLTSSKDSGILPGLEDVDPPDIRTESALMHSIPGQVSKTRE